MNPPNTRLKAVICGIYDCMNIIASFIIVPFSYLARLIQPISILDLELSILIKIYPLNA